MKQNATDLELLSALNKRFIHNFVTNDVVSHDALLHPDFRAIYTAGNHIDRASYLKQWATGFDPTVITYWDMRDQRINAFGDVALVGATNRWIRVVDGVESVGMTCYTDTYVRAGACLALCPGPTHSCRPAELPCRRYRCSQVPEGSAPVVDNRGGSSSCPSTSSTAGDAWQRVVDRCLQLGTLRMWRGRA